MNYSINFKGKYIKPVFIKSKADDGAYKNHKVSIVELDYHSCSDTKTINKVASNWNSRKTFAEDIAQTMTNFHKNNYLTTPKRFFVLTEQKDSFKKVNSDDILAVAQVTRRENNLWVDFLQVKPEFTMFEENAKYKKIGTGVLNFIKEAFNEYPIVLSPVRTAVDFYKKNGFKFEGPLMILMKK